MSDSPSSASEPRIFTIVRKSDESGVSGTGRVLDGIVFHTGQVVVCWRGDVKAEASPERDKGFSSIAIYPNWEAFKHIHVDAHPSNRTEIVFGNSDGLDESLRALSMLDENVEDEE